MQSIKDNASSLRRGAVVRPAPFAALGERLGTFWIIVLLIAGMIAAGAFWLTVIIPFTPVSTIPCPFEAVTGYECPGCGLQSSFVDLLKLRFRYVLMANMLSPILLPLFFVACISWGAEYLFGIRIWQFRIPAGVTITFVIVLIVYWILRNIPSLNVW